MAHSKKKNSAEKIFLTNILFPTYLEKLILRPKKKILILTRKNFL